jgi:glycerol uptake facilitator-like aquaporin
MQSDGSLRETIRDSLLILVFEFLGTALLCLLYSHNDVTSLFLGMFILIVLSAKISGSHYNPAITLAFMFRKDTGRFSRILGFAYFLF